MIVEPTLIFVFSLNMISLMVNGFGIYCLHMQHGGNVNQRMLLQNLSLIEMLKIVNDYISMTSYYCYKDWYDDHIVYLDIAEINILTVFFSCFVLISGERFACIMLSVKYNFYVTKSLIKDALCVTWLVGSTSGFFLWATGHHHAKAYYYVVLDVLVFVLSIVTYFSISKKYRQRKQRLSTVSITCVRSTEKEVSKREYYRISEESETQLVPKRNLHGIGLGQF